MHYSKEFGDEGNDSVLVVHKRDHVKNRPYEIELYDDEVDVNFDLTEEQAKAVYAYLGHLLGIE